MSTYLSVLKQADTEPILRHFDPKTNTWSSKMANPPSDVERVVQPVLRSNLKATAKPYVLKANRVEKKSKETMPARTVSDRHTLPFGSSAEAAPIPEPSQPVVLRKQPLFSRERKMGTNSSWRNSHRRQLSGQPRGSDKKEWPRGMRVSR